MKKQALLFVLSFFVIWGCSDKTSEEKGSGYLSLNISQSTGLKSDIQPEDFILRISDNSGVEVLSGRIGDLSEQIALPVGSYTIEAFSVVFSEPKFDTPCYSGKTEVEIVAGETNEAALVCAQSNAGIKIVWSDEFGDLYQTYQAEIRCETGYLTYSSTETRTGYFLPGNVSLNISADGKALNGGTITLSAKDLLTITLRPKESPTGVLSVEIIIDDSVNEREIEITPEPSVENSESNPYSVADAISKQGETNVWVTGYIVGSKPSSGWDFIEGAWQASNIVLADVATETVDTKCIPVALPSSGAIRESLNLLIHPEMLHQKITIRGDLAAYFSRPGLREIKAYSVE